jgi:hypothetical protein
MTGKTSDRSETGHGTGVVKHNNHLLDNWDQTRTIVDAENGQTVPVVRKEILTMLDPYTEIYDQLTLAIKKSAQAKKEQEANKDKA